MDRSLGDIHLLLLLCPVFVVLLWAISPRLLPLLELRTLRWLSEVMAEMEAVNVDVVMIQREVVDVVTRVQDNALILVRRTTFLTSAGISLEN